MKHHIRELRKKQRARQKKLKRRQAQAQKLIEAAWGDSNEMTAIAEMLISKR